jgi:hypothetical protein
MKNLGGRSCGGTQHVLYLGARQAELGGDSVDWFTGQEQVNDVVNLRAPPVLRQADQSRVPVSGEIDPAQVLVHYLRQDPLVVADDDELASGVTLGSVPGVLGVVVKNLCAIGVKPSAPKRVLKA